MSVSVRLQKRGRKLNRRIEHCISQWVFLHVKSFILKKSNELINFES